MPGGVACSIIGYHISRHTENTDSRRTMVLFLNPFRNPRSARTGSNAALLSLCRPRMIARIARVTSLSQSQKCQFSLASSLCQNSQYTRPPKTLPGFSLEGQTCIVTGAARGLGKEFLTAFARSGANGACIDLSLPAATSSIEHITSQVKTSSQSKGINLKPYSCDVTSESQVQSTINQIIKDFGKIDVLVTAAGIVDNVPAEDYSYAKWRKLMDVNLDGSFLCAREVGRHMIQQKNGGSIILVGSMCGDVCVRPQKQAAYNASKAAVIMLAKSLATEYVSHYSTLKCRYTH
ncbi:short-chain dehydrogenase, putative [Talaromyces stipitatus ATCC 10500]|uniref:Short-chain dehydrogenase, putative n=1 Tax=Talaromyces stipitatus (strain ATCC 10500 / CBS 375.48 / QM 6759 / NRRL 1006) TaxID=441959 RepID=B8MAB5_TALSN|nr:short-chain dehydrogenase, putative [Talaromyces stipitatus ATCC 10500]EED18617.1 short-chain dehydrogenase, putative [Talaromyces stipitatus ATCC 10500]